MKFHPRLEYLSVLLILTGGLLAGCGSAPTRQAANSEEQTGNQEQPTIAEVEQIPSRPLSAEELEILLEAELSGYRLDDQNATRLYAEAAERTRDIGVVTRAFEVATAFGNDERALQMATLWREIEPGLIPDRFAAQLFARVGETEAAWELGSRVDDEGVTLRIVAAETLSLGDPDRSLWLDRQMAGIEPPTYAIWMGRALINDSLNNLEPAADMAEQGFLLRPEEAVAAELYASLLARLGKGAELEELLNNWLLTYWNGGVNQARVARMVTQLPLETAIDLLQRAISRRQSTEELQLLLAQAYMNVSQEIAAEAILSRLADQPEYADVSHMNLAELAERRNQIEQALQYYAIVQPGRWFAPANQRAGQILLSVADIQAVDDYFQIQRSEYPEAAEQLYMVQASLLNDIQSGQELYDLASRSLRINPNNSDLLYLRSLAGDRMGRFDLVEQDLRQMLRIDPLDSSALNSLGYMLTERTDRYEEAEELIDRALMQDPENPAIIDSKGWVLFKLEEYDEALLWLQDALTRYYDDEIILHLAHTLLKLGRNQDAYDLIQEALRNSPNSQLLREAEQTLEFGLTPS